MLDRIFAWWNSATLGTSFTLWRRGAEPVGKDEQGNRYFEEKTPSGANGVRRRWIIYHGIADPSRVSSDWHGWLHHTYEDPPTIKPLTRQSWEADHLPNMTGTPLAHRPKGSLSHQSGEGGLDDGYEAWTPKNV